MSTRKLIIAAFICGVLILGASAIQILQVSNSNSPSSTTLLSETTTVVPITQPTMGSMPPTTSDYSY